MLFALLSVTMFGEMEIDEPWLPHILTVVVFLLCALVSNETSWLPVSMGNANQMETGCVCFKSISILMEGEKRRCFLN